MEVVRFSGIPLAEVLTLDMLSFDAIVDAMVSVRDRERAELMTDAHYAAQAQPKEFAKYRAQVLGRASGEQATKGLDDFLRDFGGGI